MMKLIVTLALALCTFSCFGQTDTCKFDKASLVRSQILSMIDSVNRYRIKDHKSDFEVFVARFYHVHDTSDFCFTLGYIENSQDYKRIHPTYFLEVGKEIVIFNFSDFKDTSALKGLGIKKISSRDLDHAHIIQKLYPWEAGFITYNPSGLTFQLYGCNIKRTFYEYATTIPENLSIYDDSLKGTIHSLTPQQFLNENSKSNKR